MELEFHLRWGSQKSEPKIGIPNIGYMVTLSCSIDTGVICQETSTRDTANKRFLELCASIVHVFLNGCSKWYVSVVFLAGQVLGKWQTQRSLPRALSVLLETVRQERSVLLAGG